MIKNRTQAIDVLVEKGNTKDMEFVCMLEHQTKQ